MKLNKYLIHIFILLLFTNSFAQEETENTEDKLPCDIDFARLLVEHQVADAKNTEDTGKRVNILIRSAVFLWGFDEEKARDHFKTAFEVAEDRFNELGFERKKYGSLKGQDLTAAVPDYRLEVIRAIAKKDSVWAEKLVKKILKQYEKDVAERKGTLNNNSEAGVLLNLAFDTLKTNPEVSLQLYRRAMAYGLGRHWFWSLYNIWRANPNMANQVYSDALNTYVNEKPSKLLFLSAYPFGLAKFFGAGRYSFPIRVPNNYVPNRDLQLRFVNVFLTRSEQFIENPNELNLIPEDNKLAEIAYIVSALNEMEPYVLQNLTGLSARFRLVQSKANSSMSEEIKKDLEKKEEEYADQTRSFNELLERVEEAHEKGTLTDQQIINMVLSARIEADYQKAETWIEKIKNKNGRDETSGYFHYNRASLAIGEKRTADAEKYSKKVTNTEQKAVISFKIAELKIKNTKQVNDVELILLDVSRLVAKLDDSISKAKLSLSLAYAFEDVNHLYALDELSKAVKVINKLEDQDIFVTVIAQEFSGDGYSFGVLLYSPGFDFQDTFTKISKKDFQLSLAHAQSLDDKYFKTIAVLTVAKNCVDTTRKRKS